MLCLLQEETVMKSLNALAALPRTNLLQALHARGMAPKLLFYELFSNNRSQEFARHLRFG